MFLLERNAMITIAPLCDPIPAGPRRFRWVMHTSLPFPFPSRKCISKSIQILGRDYTFGIHSHFERAFLTRKDNCGMPQVILKDHNQVLNVHPEEFNVSTEHLQSVATFEEQFEHSTANDAFSNADARIKACFGYLSDYLSRCQISAPYLTAWLVYPISFLDVGTIYHSVLSFCDQRNCWQPFASAPAISLARRLQHPLFFFEDKEEAEEPSIIDVTNELLAEAQLSLFRGLPRLTILNSYGAVESFANVVFKKTKLAFLIRKNVPPEVAEELVEDERQRHKTEASFLFHHGLISACQRSLLSEDKQKYDGLLALQKRRHQVAHAGYRPTDDEARDGHRLACETVRWLAEVGGMRVKPLLPEEKDVVGGFSTIALDGYAISAAERSFLAWAMGLVSKPSAPESN